MLRPSLSISSTLGIAEPVDALDVERLLEVGGVGGTSSQDLRRHAVAPQLEDCDRLVVPRRAVHG